jgi:peptide methionine sulfoxide reductase msrA/msrB
VSGYAGGSAETANYADVSGGRSAHAEAVQIKYDSSQITYAQLLHVFFSTHNPLTGNGQHPDYGKQYRPAVFYSSDDQKHVAVAYISQLDESGVFDKSVETGMEKLEVFYPAEEKHQDFVARNPQHPYVRQWALDKIAKVERKFSHLLKASEVTVSKIEKSDEQWREQLSDDAYHVLREEGTERPGSSVLNKEKRDGRFLCAGCRLDVFESNTKFESGTGWPSFYAPIKGHVVEKTDRSHGMVRTEVECARCGGHLGHVFNDGPRPTGHRYCINGVALDFEPSKDDAKGE